MKNRVDMTFKYTPACATDVRKTIKRVMRERAALASKKPTVVPMKKRGSA